ncbi:MAG: DUF4276 family protein [Phycisphaerales bacterium]
MNSATVYVLAEGSTEQTFVRDVLAPAMSCQGVYLCPALIGKSGHKGGNIRFDRAKIDIRNFLRQRHDTYVSTMFDYFRIDADWPGRAEVCQRVKSGMALRARDKAMILEAATQKAIEETCPDSDAEKRFVPYIEMHEFEALLFSDVRVLAEKADIGISALDRLLEEYGEPEEINDDPQNAPSKKIATLNHSYRKVAMGKAIAEAIGISTLRKKCTHFDEWLRKLEGLAIRTDTEWIKDT